MKQLISFIISILLAGYSFATEYFISPSGNDATGNGSAAAPWKTLYKATNSVSGVGDIIHVNAGIYIETVQCNLKPGVSIEGNNQFTTIIRSTLTSAFTPILILGSAEGTNGNQHLSGLRFEGQLKTQWGVLVSGRSNVEIKNCRFYDFYDVGVAFRGRADFNDGPPAIYSSGNSFHHNYVWNCATIDDQYGRGCLEVGGQIGMLIYNDTIIQTARATGQNGYCIKNINQGFLKGMKIYNCYLEVPPYPYAANGMGNNRWDFATEFSDVWGLEVYNNRVLGSCDQNFQRADATYPVAIKYIGNIFGRDAVQYNPESGIILEYGTEAAEISGNVFKNVAFPITYSMRAGHQINNNSITNNLMYGIGITGPSNSGQAVRFVTDGAYSYTVNNWKFLNNTVLAYASHPPFWGVDVPGGAKATNIDCSNNIIRDFQAGDIHIYDGNSITGLSVKNNNYNPGGLFLNGTPAAYTNSGNTTIFPQLGADYKPVPASPLYGQNIGFGGTVIITPPNQSPVVNAGPDLAVVLPIAGVLLEGSATDPDGTITAISWKQVSGQAVTVSGDYVTGITTAGVYEFEFKATDNGGATATDTVRVTAYAPPPPPKVILVKIHVYSDKTVSTAVRVNAKKTLVRDVIVYTDGTIE